MHAMDAFRASMEPHTPENPGGRGLGGAGGRPPRAGERHVSVHSGNMMGGGGAGGGHQGSVGGAGGGMGGMVPTFDETYDPHTDWWAVKLENEPAKNWYWGSTNSRPMLTVTVTVTVTVTFS
eukprot:1195199-Prorocentrum_minimum.AAC.5